MTISPTWPQTAGGVCQVVGLVIIGHQLMVRGREAGRVGVARRAGRGLRAGAMWLWARGWPPLGPNEDRREGQAIFLEGVAGVTFDARATLTTSLEEQVEVLGQQLHALRRQVDDLAGAARAELADEAARRVEGDRQLEGRIADHSAEHMRGERRMLGLDWTGFVLLVPGVILTTWPVEIARRVNSLLD